MMRSFDPAGMSGAVRRLNGLDEAPGPASEPESESTERGFQEAAERFLEKRGYWRLTADAAMRALGYPREGRPRGWFGHLQEARGNPLMPDLWLLDWRGRVLHVELKRPGSGPVAWRPGQREMVVMGLWAVARDMTDLSCLVKRWEGDARDLYGAGPAV